MKSVYEKTLCFKLQIVQFVQKRKKRKEPKEEKIGHREKEEAGHEIMDGAEQSFNWEHHHGGGSETGRYFGKVPDDIKVKSQGEVLTGTSLFCLLAKCHDESLRHSSPYGEELPNTYWRRQDKHGSSVSIRTSSLSVAVDL